MIRQQLPFKITPMAVPDIPAVMAIEQAAFTAYSQRDYHYELKHNQLAHYFVLRASLFSAQSPSKAQPAGESAAIIGVGSFWLINPEMHIITIAVQSGWQGLGLGEWLLLTLLEKGEALDAEMATLEVRPSNYVARSLYQKYGFQEVGRRTRYYRDNGEDALILTTPSLSLPNYQAMLTQRKTQLLPRLAQITVDKINQIN